MWCKEGLPRREYWSLREKAITIFFTERWWVISVPGVSSLELGPYFKTRLGFGGHCRPLLFKFAISSIVSTKGNVGESFGGNRVKGHTPLGCRSMFLDSDLQELLCVAQYDW